MDPDSSGKLNMSPSNRLANIVLPAPIKVIVAIISFYYPSYELQVMSTQTGGISEEVIHQPGSERIFIDVIESPVLAEKN